MMVVNVTGRPVAPVKQPGPATAGTVLPPLTVQGEKKTSSKRANGGGIR
jgi:hypothetical protein